MLKIKKTGLLLLSLSFSATAIAEDVNVNWAASLDTDFYSWEVEDTEQYGYQFVTPLNLSTTASMPERFTVNAGIRTASIVSENRSDESLGSLSAMSDTSINLAFSYDEFWIKPWISLDINAPTGKSTLKGQEKNTLMDPNLVGQTRFGEGFNISPAVGFVFEMTENDILTIGGSYNIKGKYTPDGDTNRVLDPGDIYTATLQYQRFTENTFTSIGMVYSTESATEVAGVERFEPGDRFDVNASHSYRFLPQHTLSGFFRYTNTDKNKRFDATLGNLTTEERDGAGDVFFLGLNYAHQYSQQLSAGLGFDYLLKAANEYQIESGLFIPHRNKWSVNVFSNYRITENFGLKGKVSYFGMRDAETSFSSPVDYTGATASLGFFLQY